MHRCLRWLSVYAYLCLLSNWAVPLVVAQHAAASEFELREGERVVFLGDGLIEQEQYSGWLELALMACTPNTQVTFRNLGWNGDTPVGASRSGLSLLQAGKEPPDEGWRQLQGQLEMTRPNVLIIGYGMSSILEEGAGGIDLFATQYRRLLQHVQSMSPPVRFVLLSPLVPFPADAQLSQVTAHYTSVIKALAQEFNAKLVDLQAIAREENLRQDSIHLNEAGYRELAQKVIEALGMADHVDQREWGDTLLARQLRETIVRKNTWWFHRSRPANMAYVFGFRKHEQGQNAAEIPEFDRLIAEEESRIAQLRSGRPLSTTDVEPRTISQYAEFTPQATPEFTVADGWEVSLWAENPQLNKPIHMNFDPQGRLWVASSEAYPMIEVGQSAPDKILVLEDSTGDGHADKSTVFADGLLIPTGVAPGNGGVYVAQSTDLLFLKDTNGDGRADSQQRLLSGFGTEDTHHNLHTLLWGYDGRLYMNQSVYTRTDTETPHGVVRLKAGGGFRLNTQNLHMEIFFRGLWNAWGHQLDTFGQSFLTDGAGFDGVAYTFPGACFNPTPHARRQLPLISPGKYPKFASLEIIQGPSFPNDWQGSLVTCDFRANRVTRFSVVENGAGFVTQQESDLLRTSASTFRPIDIKQGPDGALYIADWSNPIINHGEVDFRDPRRDRWHGRIWRVVWKGAAAQETRDLTQLSTSSLLPLLLSSDRYQREQSRRVLLERALEESGDVARAEIKAWARSRSLPSEQLQALWMMQALDEVDGSLLKPLLSASDARIRAAAVRVLSCWSDPKGVGRSVLNTEAALSHYKNLVLDSHPRVRLESIHGVARLGTAAAGFTALAALELPMDDFLNFALAQAVDGLAEQIMVPIENGQWVPDTPLKQRQLEFILTSIDASQASSYLSKRLAEQPLSSDGAGPWIELIGTAGGEAALEQLAEQIAMGHFTPEVTVRGLHALRDAHRMRGLRPTDGKRVVAKLLQQSEHQVMLAALELAGTWKLTGQLPRITELAMSTAASTSAAGAAGGGTLNGNSSGASNESQAIALAAIDALRAIGKPAAEDALERLTERSFSGTIRRNALSALATLAPQRVAAPFYELLLASEDEQAALDLWRAILPAKDAGKYLAAAVPGVGLSQQQAQAGMRAARDGGRDEPELQAALAVLSGMSLKPEEMTPQRIAELAEQVAEQGDATRGELIYRKSELACATCHALGGVGGKVGPDMTSLGASAPLDYIIESLFNPNAKIKEGYHSVTVATEDGQIISGIEVSSDASEVVMRDINNKLVRIAQSEVAGKKPGLSLMPVGVVDRLTHNQQLDLIAFLSQLGKPGEFDASIGGVARRLEILPGTHRLEQRGTESIVRGEAGDAWQALASLTNGNFMAEDLRALTVQPINIALVHVYARTSFTTTQTGQARLSVATDAPIKLWIDEQPLDPMVVEGHTIFTGELAAGKHRVVLRLDARELPERFKLTSRAGTFATEEFIP